MCASHSFACPLLRTASRTASALANDDALRASASSSDRSSCARRAVRQVRRAESSAFFDATAARCAAIRAEMDEKPPSSSAKRASSRVMRSLRSLTRDFSTTICSRSVVTFCIAALCWASSEATTLACWVASLPAASAFSTATTASATCSFASSAVSPFRSSAMTRELARSASTFFCLSRRAVSQSLRVASATSTSSWVANSSVFLAGEGCSSAPQTGQGAPSFSSIARFAAVDAIQAVVRRSCSALALINLASFAATCFSVASISFWSPSRSLTRWCRARASSKEALAAGNPAYV